MRRIFLLFCIATLLGVFTNSSQYVPIPRRQIGIFSGHLNAPIHIQLVYDITCDDTKNFDAQFRETIAKLDQSTKSQIQLRFVSLPLPHHITSAKLTQGLILVLDKKGNEEALRYLRYFLDNQASWNQNSLKTQTLTQFMMRLSKKIQEMFLISSSEVFPQLLHYSVYDSRSRGWGKYATGSLRAAGTPRLFINGAKVDNGTTMSQQQLVKLIKSLL